MKMFGKAQMSPEQFTEINKNNSIFTKQNKSIKCVKIKSYMKKKKCAKPFGESPLTRTLTLTL